jgi:hypothetical protein
MQPVINPLKCSIMKNMSKYIIAIICLISINSLAHAQLKLTLVSEKTSYQLGEPILVYITVTNTGNDAVSIYEEFKPEMTEYAYFITGPNSEEQIFSPIMVAEPDKLVSLKRGASISGSVELFFGAGKYYFSEPGNYKISVKHKEFTSNPLSIKVLEPANNEEKEIAKMILGSKEMGLYYELGGNDELVEANQNLDRLAKEYSQYRITNYFLQVKAQNLSVPARNFVTNKHRAPMYEDALKILNEVKKTKMPLYYQSKSAALTAKIYRKTDRKDEAIKELNTFKTTLDRNQTYKKYLINDINKTLTIIEK